MKLYGILFDGGDGSASIRWFTEDKHDVMQDLLENCDYCMMINEGSPAAVITLPDGFDVQAAGFRLYREE